MALICFFRAEKAESMCRGFAVLPGWSDASALAMEVLTQPNGRSIRPSYNSLKLFWLAQSTLLGKVALCVKEKRTLWNTVVNAGVAAVDNRNIDEDIAWYTSLTRLLQDFLEENGARMWVEKRRALRDVWHA